MYETILVAEDCPYVREMMKEVLMCNRYKVITAADGTEAVRKYKESKNEILLFITDINLPVMNGDEAYEEIKK